MTFVCPQCHAKVTKEVGSELGCPCCGYAAAGVAPYYPFIYPQPSLPLPLYPVIPLVVGPNTGDLCPDCAKPSTTAPYTGPSSWVGDIIPNPFQVSSTGGTALSVN